MADIVDLRAHAAAAAKANSAEVQQEIIDILYEGPEGKILRPGNKFAAAKLAEGTGWDIANTKYDAFERCGTPVVVFVPRPREASAVSKFTDAAVVAYRERFDAVTLAAEAQFDKTEKYYASNKGGPLRGPFVRCVKPLVDIPNTPAVPQHNYYSLNRGWGTKAKIPNSLLELVLAASLKDPKKGEYIFENLPLHIQWVPEQYRTVSICLGALRRAEQHRGGNSFDVFHHIPDEVKQDRAFQQAVMTEFNNPFIQYYRVVETAKKPATLIKVELHNQDLGIDNRFTLKDGIK